MKIEKKAINFEDERGSIQDILVGSEVDAITLLTCTPGAVRGNHFHKESTQYLYVISGKLLYVSQMGDNPIERKEITEGDLVTNPPGEKHALKALEKSLVLSITKGPRKGENFEKDTYRLEDPILQ